MSSFLARHLYVYICFLYKLLVYRRFNFIVNHARHLGFQWKVHPPGICFGKVHYSIYDLRWNNRQLQQFDKQKGYHAQNISHEVESGWDLSSPPPPQAVVLSVEI